jgi:putative ABC transport system permease protein
MKLIDIIKDANRNLLRNKIRTFLTVSAVFIGAFTLALTNGLGDGIRAYVNVQLGNAGAKNVLFITAKDESQQQKDQNGGLTLYNPDRLVNTSVRNGPSGTSLLVDKDVTTIEAIPGIEKVYKTYQATPEFMSTGGQKFNASIDQYTEGINFQLDAGRLVDNTSDNEITVPRSYLQPLGFGASASNALNKMITFAFKNAQGQLFEKTGTIVGVQAKSLIGATTINVSANFIRQIQTQQQGTYVTAHPTYVFIQAKFDDTKGDAYKTTLVNRLDAAGYTSKTFEDQLGIVTSVINSIIIGLDLFGAIALVSASFGIVNTLYISVQERTKEIGLMKALGLSKRKIFSLFSIEAVLIGFWGSLLGVLAANGAGLLIDHIANQTFLKDFENFQLLAFPLHSKLVVILLILVIAFLAGSLPARKASQKDPIEALRYE